MGSNVCLPISFIPFCYACTPSGSEERNIGSSKLDFLVAADPLSSAGRQGDPFHRKSPHQGQPAAHWAWSGACAFRSCPSSFGQSVHSRPEPNAGRPHSPGRASGKSPLVAGNHPPSFGNPHGPFPSSVRRMARVSPGPPQRLVPFGVPPTGSLGGSLLGLVRVRSPYFRSRRLPLQGGQCPVANRARAIPGPTLAPYVTHRGGEISETCHATCRQNRSASPGNSAIFAGQGLANPCFRRPRCADGHDPTSFVGPFRNPASPHRRHRAQFGTADRPGPPDLRERCPGIGQAHSDVLRRSHPRDGIGHARGVPSSLAGRPRRRKRLPFRRGSCGFSKNQ